MSSYRVSVVIPTRNRAEKLRRALASVNQQTFRNFDVWLVDDGSTDGTRNFLDSRRLAMAYPNIPSITVLFNEHRLGAAAARNRALSKAGGELIAFLDDDDVWLPDYLQQQIRQLDHHPNVAACCARHVAIGACGGSHQADVSPLFAYGHPLIQLLTESFVHSMSVFVCRRQAFETLGLLDEKLSIVHDWEWYARLLLSGKSILIPTGPVLVRREISSGLVARHRQWHQEEQSVLRRVLLENTEFSNEYGQVRAYRALVFAKLGVVRKDYTFALCRLVEAFWMAPLRCMKIIFFRLRRNAKFTRAGGLSGDHGSSPYS